MLKGVIPAVGSADEVKAYGNKSQIKFLSGRLVTQTLLGSDNEGLISLSEYSQHFRNTHVETDNPLIADGQSGFGNPLSMWNTGIELGRSNADYMMINDQSYPSHSKEVSGVDDEETLLGKVKSALDGTEKWNVEVIVKFESIKEYGIEGLVKRIKLVKKAGVKEIVVSRFNKELLEELSKSINLNEIGLELDDEEVSLDEVKKFEPMFIIPVTATLTARGSYRESLKALN